MRAPPALNLPLYIAGWPISFLSERLGKWRSLLAIGNVPEMKVSCTVPCYRTPAITRASFPKAGGGDQHKSSEKPAGAPCQAPSSLFTSQITAAPPAVAAPTQGPPAAAQQMPPEPAAECCRATRTTTWALAQVQEGDIAVMCCPTQLLVTCTASPQVAQLNLGKHFRATMQSHLPTTAWQGPVSGSVHVALLSEDKALAGQWN